jgi:predicted flavoprotein YhiN
LEVFSGVLHEKLLLCAFEDAGVDAEVQISAPAGEELSELQEVWKLLRYRKYRVLHAADFAHAQTSTGGVSLQEVTGDLELRHYPGLFLTGEMLDVDGICGGYNLQFAWSTGIIAGRKAAEGGRL